MADTLPSSPESRSSTPDEAANRDALTTRLDELLEQYLELLHQYTNLREDLSKSFSSGFFALAQAQRASTLGAGRRYGEEYYDERMKAQRKICWNTDLGAVHVECSIVREEQSESRGAKAHQSKEASTVDNEHLTETQAADNVEKDEQGHSKAVGPSKQHSKNAKPKQDPAQRDPLTWFGILVPPALRQTQGHFSLAFEGQVPGLVNVRLSMQRIEHQIWTVRERLGILSEYESQETSTGEAVPEAAKGTQEVDMGTSTKNGKPSRNSLNSRPVHVKSHLLKLGD